MMKGELFMITAKKCIKLLSCSDAELDKEIDKMSEKDAKYLAKICIKTIKNPSGTEQIIK